MRKNPADFSEQTLVIAGAAQGIGKATAQLLHERGARIVALDISSEGLSSLQTELSLDKNQVHQINLADQDAVFSTIARVQSDHGQIHALVNSVGIVGPSGINIENISWNDFEKTLAINLFGAIWLTQAVIPSMKENAYGRIAHLASIAGKEGNPGMSPYNVSKSAMIGFVKGVAKEVASFGITVNALAPAVINTHMNANTSEETLKYMISRIPMGRLGEVDEIAQMLAFMASKACSFTTGFTFDASGGRATY